VHGLLGVGLEQSLGTTLVSACGSSRGFRFGGKDEDGVHLAGWDRDTWEDVGIAPEVGDGDFGWTRRVRAIAPDTGQGPAAPGWRQVHPSTGDTQARAETFEFETGARDVVFVTNRFIHHAPMEILEASAGGRPALRVHAGRLGSGFRCDGCGGGSNVHWRVRLQAAIDLVDVYVVQGALDPPARASQLAGVPAPPLRTAPARRPWR
jgi:hypothetical protein